MPTNSNTSLDRKQLRRDMRSQRRCLSASTQRKHAHQVCKLLSQQLFFRRAKHIALYLPNDGEISAVPLIELCWKLKKTVYLPVLHPILHNCLWFIPYTPQSRMRLNGYKIKEPIIENSPARPAWALDMVCLPLVAFDQNGGRLGMGGGYYDRSFSFKHHKKGLRGPRLIGLAHGLQQVDQLPIEDWDVPLAGVATEHHLHLF
ncbi:MAG: 5-formyltetrahydrofolate cyclo-ligase [Oceanospirillales bacterium]|nr:MAG: 5-formyltetrahydrofolate cyclo-ligase [Oceanospirillales bacterium]